MLPTIESSTFVSEGKAIAKAALVAKNKVDAANITNMTPLSVVKNRFINLPYGLYRYN